MQHGPLIPVCMHSRFSPCGYLPSQRVIFNAAIFLHSRLIASYRPAFPGLPSWRQQALWEVIAEMECARLQGDDDQTQRLKRIAWRLVRVLDMASSA